VIDDSSSWEVVGPTRAGTKKNAKSILFLLWHDTKYMRAAPSVNVLTPCSTARTANGHGLFAPSGACLTESREPATRASFVSTLSEVSFTSDLFFFDDDDDGWLSCLNYVPLSTCMAVSAFC